MPPSTDSTSAQDRLTNIKAHMAGSNSTVFTSDKVPQAPEDPLFGLITAYKKVWVLRGEILSAEADGFM